MFGYAQAFNQDLSPWALDLSNVTDMTRMFYNASVFNQDLSAWLMPLVSGEGIYQMFTDATLSTSNKESMGSAWGVGTSNNFSYPNISNAGLINSNIVPFSSVASLTDMSCMWEFGYFNSTQYPSNDLSGWILNIK